MRGGCVGCGRCRIDASKRTVVEIAVSGATAEQIAELEAALEPLPQTYDVRSAAAPDEGVTLAFDDGIAVLTLNRPRQHERAVAGDDEVAGATASRSWPACRTCASWSSPVRAAHSAPAAT